MRTGSAPGGAQSFLSKHLMLLSEQYSWRGRTQEGWLWGGWSPGVRRAGCGEAGTQGSGGLAVGRLEPRGHRQAGYGD